MTTDRLPAHILVFDDAEEVAKAAADRFIELAGEAVASDGRFSVALAGGSTPRRTYQMLASDEYRERIDWARVHIFFGDERCVPPTDSESNYHMAYEAMLSRLPVLPRENVHRMMGEGDPSSGARLYEQELRSFFPDAPWPRFDLVLLGMGDDGHTASLFPDTHALREEQAWVAANWVGKLKTFRLTLTVPAINHAANVLFMVTGAAKAECLSEVIHAPRDPERLPAQMIRTVNGWLTWLVDKEAARLL
ncbi:MAG TPA: 6-phosphogluconolactonase [Pyrinomonadaceae bacterium]|jgi:6-phosphogluconolactonase